MVAWCDAAVGLLDPDHSVDAGLGGSSICESTLASFRTIISLTHDELSHFSSSLHALFLYMLICWYDSKI
jgi:hypothetical protein